MSMYRIPGLDEEEEFQQLLGRTPLDDTPEGFQAQQAPPEIATGLDGSNTTQQLDDMTTDGSDVAAMMAQLGQSYNAGGGAGANRIAQQRQANEAAIQQEQQSKGGGLLGFAMKFLPWTSWIGKAGKAIGAAIGLNGGGKKTA